MSLPNVDAAEIPEDKIAGYLLSATHRAGKSKAAFFGKHGFGAGDWRVLADALRRHAAENRVARAEQTRYGTRYIVDGPLPAPDGTLLNVRSVWFISGGRAEPRFATAHPLKRRIE